MTMVKVIVKSEQVYHGRKLEDVSIHYVLTISKEKAIKHVEEHLIEAGWTPVSFQCETYYLHNDL